MDYKVLSVDDFNIGELEITNLAPTLISETVSYKTVAMSRGIHRLEVSGSIMLENQDQVRKWQAFILGVLGRAMPWKLDTGADSSWHNPFYLPVRGVTLSTSGGIGNTKLTVSQVNQMRLGALVQFGDNLKIHVITDIQQQNSQITIFPPLPYAMPQGTPLKFDVKPLLRFDEDNFKVIYGSRGNEVNFKASEAIL
ncbi:hypothetical protein ACW5XW_23955 [Aeromonas piscicola]|uniref:hypothetical protein n=1 Tax=Aeromonas piscicola TaxID=600645 RepID=UPI0005B3CEAA|nr:hypothetical protein [Aeromonas piscicola]